MIYCPSQPQRRGRSEQTESGLLIWPHANIFRQEDKHMRLGKPDSYVRDRPAHEPEESDLVLKLAGVKAY